MQYLIGTSLCRWFVSTTCVNGAGGARRYAKHTAHAFDPREPANTAVFAPVRI